MHTHPLVQQVIENPPLCEKLSRNDALALVPLLVEEFHQRRLWPKDAAALIAACLPTDEQLTRLLKSDSERVQSLGLHVLELLINSNKLEQGSSATLALEVLRLLQTQAMRPKHKHLGRLTTWAESQVASSRL
ncbi:hypothetical protein AB1K70_05440 [Bremerella sp. JC770]|uniref:hypothetical protein n=1 Tax=Bremerella sp. JC770 TaxID=3232137 RepID=UPI00345ADE0B